MKTNRMLFSAVILLALTLPASGQERGQPAAEDRGSRAVGGDSGATSSMGSSSMGSRGISVGDSSGMSTSGPRMSSGTAGTVANFPNSSIYSGNANSATPNFSGTSYYSYDTYYQMENFLWYLRTHYYGLDPRYGMRFLRNREPLLTPQLLKMALREPVSLSTQLVRAVDELEVMLLDRQAGKTLNKQEIANKTQVIRELAKKIRQDHSMVFVDQRLEKTVIKGKEVDNLGLEAISKLREMTLDLNHQLKEMYDQTKTSIVSVGNLSQPSIESLSKGIEKLSKVIENSARRL
jgi:gas vesicle protein